MVLTPERIMELSDKLLRVVGAGYVRPQDADGFARAIEAEVHKQDAALIQKLVEALEAMQAEAAARSCGLRICDEAITLGRAHLKEKA